MATVGAHTTDQHRRYELIVNTVLRKNICYYKINCNVLFDTASEF